MRTITHITVVVYEMLREGDKQYMFLSVSLSVVSTDVNLLRRYSWEWAIIGKSNAIPSATNIHRNSIAQSNEYHMSGDNYSTAYVWWGSMYLHWVYVIVQSSLCKWMVGWIFVCCKIRQNPWHTVRGNNEPCTMTLCNYIINSIKKIFQIRKFKFLSYLLKRFQYRTKRIGG